MDRPRVKRSCDHRVGGGEQALPALAAARVEARRLVPAEVHVKDNVSARNVVGKGGETSIFGPTSVSVALSPAGRPST